MGDACERCRGRGIVPVVSGKYDAWVTCPTCNGSAGRMRAPGPRDRTIRREPPAG